MNKEYVKEVKQYIFDKGYLNSDFNEFSKIYSMTTENIGGFLNQLDLKDKNVLTVASSGDQRINAYMLGAKHVKCFDVNPLSSLHLDLKDTALRLVNYEKFIKFFGIYSKRYGDYYNFLDKDIFNEIKNDVSKETFDFYNYIINERLFINHFDIYQGFSNNLSLLKKMNNYLTKDDYEKAKQIISTKKIDFIESNIKELPNELGNEKYDLILLSNISDYIHLIYEKKQLFCYRELIDELANHLNDNGIIQAGYIYSIYHKETNVSDFKIDYKRKKYFLDKDFTTISVDSYNNNGEKDKILVYRKK